MGGVVSNLKRGHSKERRGWIEVRIGSRLAEKMGWKWIVGFPQAKKRAEQEEKRVLMMMNWASCCGGQKVDFQCAKRRQ